MLLAIALNPMERQRTRHIDIRYKWVIDRLQKKDFRIAHVATESQVADGLTKGLRKDRHHVFVRQLNMTTISEFHTIMSGRDNKIS
jgi:hypothetical protein